MAPQSGDPARLRGETRCAEIVSGLAAAIARGEPGPGGRLASERELAAAWGCTRPTVREALGRLAADGAVFRRRRRGWFVAPPRLLYEPARHRPFHLLARDQRRVAATEVVTVGRTEGDPTTFEVVRRRLLDGRPVLVERNMLPAELFPDLDRRDLRGSLTEISAQVYGIEVERELVTVRSTSLTEEIADLLDALPGAAALRIDRERYEGGRVVENDTEWWLHDALEILVEVTSRSG